MGLASPKMHSFLEARGRFSPLQARLWERGVVVKVFVCGETAEAAGGLYVGAAIEVGGHAVGVRREVE